MKGNELQELYPQSEWIHTNPRVQIWRSIGDLSIEEIAHNRRRQALFPNKVDFKEFTKEDKEVYIEDSKAKH
ncbi:hypothetical protein AHAS_Ahas11G0181600 [Arachis hypogaea]